MNAMRLHTRCRQMGSRFIASSASMRRMPKAVFQQATLRNWSASTYLRGRSNHALTSRNFGTMAEQKDVTVLEANENQALGIGEFAIDFLSGKFEGPSEAVLKRVELFHTDAVVAGLSALALKTNAPTVLRAEALDYPEPEESKYGGAKVFGSNVSVKPEKACLANGSAVREWDTNGTVFGYNKALNHIAGEFGHNDFYGVVIAACQIKKLDGKTALKAMVLLDEIRGRLCEVFSLKSYKIDHTVHGAIASAAVFGALMGATAKQIEYAIGMTVAHYIPFRAIRAGKQLSDSKGASAAISTEVAILATKRAMAGFVGPADIFRNPQSIFRLNEPTSGDSPFRLVLSHSGDDFAVMGMHFKLGLYEHQSAGAIQGVLDALKQNPDLVSSPDAISEIEIKIYEPAFGIIGDPAKRSCDTRQSADHSMVYIIASVIKKALDLEGGISSSWSDDEMWMKIGLLVPDDYNYAAIHNTLDGTDVRKQIADKITFVHGGKEYDDKYPDGIPTSCKITSKDGQVFDSGLVMYPGGHARNTTVKLEDILQNKFQTLGALAVADVDGVLSKLNNLDGKGDADIQSLYDFTLREDQPAVDKEVKK